MEMEVKKMSDTVGNLKSKMTDLSGSLSSQRQKMSESMSTQQQKMKDSVSAVQAKMQDYGVQIADYLKTIDADVQNYKFIVEKTDNGLSMDIEFKAHISQAEISTAM
jgi:phage host-nuclease inhibitor protein Gam